jgi:NO-binding membrane sensor protein with MHYT domain
MKRDLYWIVVLGLVATAMVIALDRVNRDPGSDPWETLPARLGGVAVCFGASLFSWILNTEAFERKNPVASVLLFGLVRTMVVLGALGFATATKWNNHNFFVSTLVGCYFSFLALESCLQIRRIHSRI